MCLHGIASGQRLAIAENLYEYHSSINRSQANAERNFSGAFSVVSSPASWGPRRRQTRYSTRRTEELSAPVRSLSAFEERISPSYTPFDN